MKRITVGALALVLFSAPLAPAQTSLGTPAPPGARPVAPREPAPGGAPREPVAPGGAPRELSAALHAGCDAGGVR